MSTFVAPKIGYSAMTAVIVMNTPTTPTAKIDRTFSDLFATSSHSR